MSAFPIPVACVVRSLTANQEVPDSILGLVEGFSFATPSVDRRVTLLAYYLRELKNNR